MPDPTIANWARGLARLCARFDGGTGPLPRVLVGRAEGLLAELIPLQAAPVMLHGDRHHGRLLAATRQLFLAIDPKGVIGAPAS